MILPITAAKYKLLKYVYAAGEIKITDLFKKAKLSPQAGYKYLDGLIKAGVLIEKITGKKPLLRILKPNLNTEAGKICFSLIEVQKNVDFFAKNPFLKGPFTQFAKELEKLVDCALIFGSFARGTATKISDIDLAILTQKLRPEQKDKITTVCERCFITLKNKVSIRLLDTKEFIRASREKDSFALQIIKDHVLVFGATKWISILAEILR